MKVALVTEYSNIGGGESNLLNLARELSKFIEVSLFCPDGLLAEQAVNAGIRHYPIDRVKFRGWIKGLPLIIKNSALTKLLNQFDLVHCYSLHVLPRLFGIKKPLVWTNHGYWEKVRGVRAWVISRFVSRIITVSSETFEYARLPERMKTMVHLGIPDKQLIAQKKTEKQSGITIICIARYQRIKGQDLLIKSLVNVAANTPHIHYNLYLVGDMLENNKADLNFKEDVIELINSNRSLPNLVIHVEGFKKDVSDYYLKCDFLVVPSHYESFSMVTVEALSFGKPVIVPNVGGPKDIVNSDQIGICFVPGNQVSLQNALHKMVMNFSNYESNKCKERAADFSISKQAEKHLCIYNECIQKSENQ